MNLERVVKELQETNAPVTFKTKGNSMTPKISSGEVVTVSPMKGVPKKGAIVLAKVRGNYYLHLVTAVEKDRVQISNNHGHVNGWTSARNVYGIKI